MRDHTAADQHGAIAVLFAGFVFIGYLLVAQLSNPREVGFAGFRRWANRCIARIAMGTMAGVLAGWFFYALHYLIQGMMAVDVWFYFEWYAMFGGTIGFAVGVVWGWFGSPPGSR